MSSTPPDPVDPLAELRTQLEAFITATTCTTPAYGHPAHAHCAACCYGTLISASCIEEFEGATLARRLLDNLNGAPTAGTYDRIIAGDYTEGPRS